MFVCLLSLALSEDNTLGSEGHLVMLALPWASSFSLLEACNVMWSCLSCGFQIHYECVPGFELVGKDTRYCQSDGTWTPSELPACVPVQCPIPDSPVNGKAMFTAVAYKSVVSYECKYGFMIIGDATRFVVLLRRHHLRSSLRNLFSFCPQNLWRG